MAELQPLPFAALLRRMFREFRGQGRIFDMRADRFWRGSPAGRNPGVRFHGLPAGSPLGPAAGPHTQMAQNIVLSWLGGGRIIELKTVQIDDRLTIARPCIDATNVGYNIEFSQELLVGQSLDEYVKAWMLIRVIEHEGWLGHPARQTPTAIGAPPDFHDTVFDLSVGYDLEGIRGAKMAGFIRGLMDASAMIERLKSEIPPELARLRDIDYDPAVSRTATLSTFHGCPAAEIEGIVDHLLRTHGLHVVVKMNPTMLGEARLTEILHGELGYDELAVNPTAYTSGLGFEESVAMTGRLAATARSLGLGVGAKFTNTLEVINHRDFFAPTEKVMYASGAPLHPLALTLASDFREAWAVSRGATAVGAGESGEGLAFTFSAGIDKTNFAGVAACGFAAVTTCTDLLKPGGYGRMVDYMTALDAAMGAAGVNDMPAFVAAGDGPGPRHRALVRTTVLDARYSKARNAVVPRRIGSELWLFDCIACDKCVPVCPNDANFTFETPDAEIGYRDYLVQAGHAVPTGEARHFKLRKAHQIANMAGLCNECGNCDTFCPEYGGPFIRKPAFFPDRAAYAATTGKDGFVMERIPDGTSRLTGRMKGVEYELTVTPEARHRFRGPGADFWIDAETAVPVESAGAAAEGASIDVGAYLAFRTLLAGVADSPNANWVNAGLLPVEAS